MIKALSKPGIQHSFINLVKKEKKKRGKEKKRKRSSKPRTNIIPNVKKIEAFLLRSGTRKKKSLLKTSFQDRAGSSN